jgi:hypothetical protein
MTWHDWLALTSGTLASVSAFFMLRPKTGLRRRRAPPATQPGDILVEDIAFLSMMVLTDHAGLPACWRDDKAMMEPRAWRWAHHTRTGTWPDHLWEREVARMVVGDFSMRVRVFSSP